MSKSRVVEQLHGGINEIRLQHKRVIQYYQQVEELIASGVEDFAALESVLDGLIDYTISSFDLEENLMKLVGYKQTGEHLKSHDMFMRRLSGYRGSLQKGKYAANELMSLLKIWKAGHLEEQDMHFLDALKQTAMGAA